MAVDAILKAFWEPWAPFSQLFVSTARGPGRCQNSEGQKKEPKGSTSDRKVIGTGVVQS